MKAVKRSDETPAQAGKQDKVKPLKKSAPARKAETPKRKAPRKAEVSRFDFVRRARQYLREVAYELKKVVWPSRKETVATTSVVLVVVVLAGLFLGFVDLVLSRFVRFLIG